MKKTILIMVLLMFSIVSCKKDFQEPLASPVPETALKAVITVNKTSIQAAIDGATSGDLIKVMKGTYIEQLTLKDGVNMNFQNGAIVDGGDGVALTDGDGPVTCVITGEGTFLSTPGGASTYAVYFKWNDSDITFDWLLADDGFRIDGGTYTLSGEIKGTDYGFAAGVFGGYWGGTINGSYTGDVTLIGGSSAIVYGAAGYFTYNGTALAYMHPEFGWCGTSVEKAGGPGTLEISGYFWSENYYGVNIHGGDLYVHDATIKSSTGIANWQEYGGDAIWICGGDNLTFGPNVTLFASTAVQPGTSWWNGIWSIGNEGCQPDRSAVVTTTDTLWTNLPYVTEQLGPNGEQWYDLNWSTGSEDLVFSFPVQNLQYDKVGGNPKTLNLTWDEYGEPYDVYKNGELVETGLLTPTYTETYTGKWNSSTFTVTNSGWNPPPGTSIFVK